VAASLAILVLASAAPAHAGLVITPTFDSSITNDPNAAAIEGVINSAISVYENLFTNPITVAIEFHEMPTGLGSSSTFISFNTYTAYLTALQANATSAAQLTALASLPAGPNNPVNGNADVFLTTANVRALGGNVFPPTGQPDSSIGLNTSITFPPNAQSSSTFSLLAVTEHEINEALGLGSALNGHFNGSSPPTSAVSPMDLYRYDQNGNRSFTTDPNAQAFFSINGGKTDLVQFNQFSTSATPADYQDWFSIVPPPTPQVQDAFATPGATPTLGPNEITALNVLGYNLKVSAVPEPAAVLLLGTGMLVVSGFGLRRRRPPAGHHAA
jgi:hypothetical protein